MNILILTDYYPPDKLGGVGEIAKNLKLAYEAKGHRVWVLTTGTSKEKNVVCSSSSLNRGVFLNNIQAIKLIRKHKIDIVNMHQSTTSLFLLTKYLPYFYKKFPKVVNSFQVSYFSEFKHIKSVKIFDKTFRPTAKEYVEKFVFAPVHILLDFVGFMLSDVVTVVSTENKQEFDSTYGKLLRKKIKIIPNGVNADVFKPRKAKLNKDTAKKIVGKTVLLYVGVFRVRKRVFNLLYALQEADADDVVLILVGGGRNYEEPIKELAKELGIEQKIIFVGRIPNTEVVNYLNSADVFCLPSSYEGMPVAILEAMSSGKAVLTSRASGMIDLVEDNETGFLTEVDDITAIANKISYFSENKKVAKTMGDYARKKILNQYTWHDIAQSYLEIF